MAGMPSQEAGLPVVNFEYMVDQVRANRPHQQQDKQRQADSAGRRVPAIPAQG